MGKIFFIPHGGGPLPLLGDPNYARLTAMLEGLHSKIDGAKAVILITAHWETERPCLTISERPELLYDYSGFPKESYRISYSAPGAPWLADAVVSALATVGFEAELDRDRGFDHGTFVPMKLIRPEADIPILQMSLLSSLDPAQHLMMGRGLADVLEEEIVLIGSGFSFHNLAALTGRLSQEDATLGQTLAIDFHAWLDSVVCDPSKSGVTRRKALIEWATAPGARFCQPREEHLLPLHVCIGAAEELKLTAAKVFSEPVKRYQTSGYYWR